MPWLRNLQKSKKKISENLTRSATYAKIIVNCFLEKPWYKGGGRELLAENEFECSPCGLAEAVSHLNNECQKFMEDDTIV